MSVQALLRQRACTQSILSITSSSRGIRSYRRSYSAQTHSDLHPQDASAHAGPSDLSHAQGVQNFATDMENTFAELIAQDHTPISPAVETVPTPKRQRSTRTEVEKRPEKAVGSRTRVQKYLSSINTAGQEPTIEDIERCRPRQYSRPGSSKYVEEFNALVNTLSHSFTKRQLQDCVRQYGIRVKKSRLVPTKMDFVEAIIVEQWGWPSLEMLEKRERDETEVARKQIKITPSDLFLLLGPNGKDLMQLSSRHKVQVTVSREPLSLDVQGKRNSVQLFKEAVKALRDENATETLHLPIPFQIPPELRQRLSRLTEAYIENIGTEGLIKICARNEVALRRAKRFTARTISQIHGRERRDLYTHILPYHASEVGQQPEEPRAHALYPFKSPYPLPWVVDAPACFRVRKVTEWLFPPTMDAEKEPYFSQGSGELVGSEGHPINIQELLCAPQNNDHSDFKIKARPGHVLFSAKPSSEAQSLLGPLQGQHSLEKVRDWMSTYDAPLFASNLPYSLVEPSPSAQKVLYRLIYRAHADKEELSNAKSNIKESITLEIAFAQPKESQGSTEEEGSDIPSFTVQYTRAAESAVDVMLPDRAMDIQFIKSLTNELSEAEQPPVLHAYTDKLHDYVASSSSDVSLPDPPISWRVPGRTYVLHDFCIVRQTVESLTPQNAVISESVLDIDSKQRSAYCEIVCTAPSVEDQWREFLKTCDKHISAFYVPQNNISGSLGGDILEI